MCSGTSSRSRMAGTTSTARKTAAPKGFSLPNPAKARRLGRNLVRFAPQRSSWPAGSSGKKTFPVSSTVEIGLGTPHAISSKIKPFHVPTNSTRMSFPCRHCICTFFQPYLWQCSLFIATPLLLLVLMSTSAVYEKEEPSRDERLPWQLTLAPRGPRDDRLWSSFGRRAVSNVIPSNVVKEASKQDFIRSPCRPCTNILQCCVASAFLL
jgi:hypothetical protein